jgi:Immunoglobulin-like domain of bacterial spore germination
VTFASCRALAIGAAMQPMKKRTKLVVLPLAMLVVACDGDNGGEATTSRSSATTTAPTTTSPDTSAAPTTTQAGTTTTLPAEPGQLAIWPAAGVVFTTPEDAAADFITTVFEVPAVLGDFTQGDARSGEIVVFLTDGERELDSPRATLLMRQLGPSDGWFVIAAVSDGASISEPVAGATVPPGPVTVAGEARGFEATVVVEAFLAGDGKLDEAVVQAGNFDELLPFSVTLNLEGAETGAVVMLLVRGTVGLETDPGEFAAAPVVIGG